MESDVTIHSINNIKPSGMIISTIEPTLALSGKKPKSERVINKEIERL